MPGDGLEDYASFESGQGGSGAEVDSEAESQVSTGKGGGLAVEAELVRVLER